MSLHTGQASWTIVMLPGRTFENVQVTFSPSATLTVAVRVGTSVVDAALLLSPASEFAALLAQAPGICSPSHVCGILVKRLRDKRVDV